MEKKVFVPTHLKGRVSLKNSSINSSVGKSHKTFKVITGVGFTTLVFGVVLFIAFVRFAMGGTAEDIPTLQSLFSFLSSQTNFGDYLFLVTNVDLKSALSGDWGAFDFLRRFFAGFNSILVAGRYLLSQALNVVFMFVKFLGYIFTF